MRRAIQTTIRLSFTNIIIETYCLQICQQWQGKRTDPISYFHNILDDCRVLSE